jgi:hypothetical protein
LFLVGRKLFSGKRNGFLHLLTAISDYLQEPDLEMGMLIATIDHL